jgi:hypothetical protein
MLGMMTWYLELGGVKPEKRRVTAGPTIEEIRHMLDATSGDTEPETRDYAIVLTFFAVGLCVSELCGLNLKDTDLARATTWIKGNGRRERELVPLPPPVVEAIRRYFAASGRSSAASSQRRYGGTRESGAEPLFQSAGTEASIGMAAHRCAATSLGTVSVLGDALIGVLISRIPRIKAKLARDRSRLLKRLVATLVGELKWAGPPAQDVDGRRMDLSVNDDVARLRQHCALSVLAR